MIAVCYTVARLGLLHLLLSLFGVSWVFPHKVKELLLVGAGSWWEGKDEKCGERLSCVFFFG